MRFKFKLEPLHKYKKQMVDLEQQKFAQLSQKLMGLDVEILHLRQELSENIGLDKKYGLENSTTLNDSIQSVQSLQRRESHLRRLHLGLKELGEQKQIVLKEYNQQKNILHTVHKESKILDKSREKAFSAFHEHLQRKAEKVLNEQSIQRYQRV